MKYNQDFRIESIYSGHAAMSVYSSIKGSSLLNIAYSPHTFYQRGEISQSVGIERNDVGSIIYLFILKILVEYFH